MDLGSLLDGPESIRVGFRPISVEARRALKAELIPSKPADMPPDQFAREMSEQLRTALKEKDDWYTRLIRYKPIDLVDEAFWDDMLYVLSEWAQKQTLGPAQTTPKDPQQQQQQVLQIVMPQNNPEASQALQDGLSKALQPDQNLTPWALTASLNGIFQNHGVCAKAQVVPAPLDKISTSQGKCRHLVAIVVGEGFTPSQIDLRHYPGTGWYDPLGLGSPEQSAKSILNEIEQA